MLINKRVRTTVLASVIVTVAALLPALLFSSNAIAETVDSASTNVLKITPVRTDIQIPAGETKTVKVTVTNLTDRDITVRPIENDFTAGDERGTPALILDQDEYAETHSLKRFMIPLPDVTIPANSAQAVEVTIRVPATAQAGGYFGALRFAPVSPEDGGQVNLSTSVASLILMTVPGDAVEKLTLTDFSIQQNGKTGDNFSTANDIQVTLRLQNEGNIQMGPFGKISVTQGSEVVYDYDFNTEQPRDMVLPDSARRWDVPLKNIGSFGHYTVTATLTYGESNQTIEVTKSFWVIPTIVIVGAIVGTLLLVAIIITVILVVRNSKRRVKTLRGNRGAYRGGRY